MNQDEWDKIKEQIKYQQNIGDKHPVLRKIRKLILWFSLVIVPLIPLVLTENFVAISALCQWFIGVMSSWIPGIDVISHASVIPNISALVVSLAWIAICLLFIVLLQFLLELGSENYFIFFSKSTKLMIVFLIFATLVLMDEFDPSSHRSFFYGTTALFDPSTRHNFSHTMIQSRVGLGFFAFFEIFWLMAMSLGWVMASLQIFGKLIKRS